jgi:hypothetical protein
VHDAVHINKQVVALKGVGALSQMPQEAMVLQITPKAWNTHMLDKLTKKKRDM